jgi:hypothetical protein
MSEKREMPKLNYEPLHAFAEKHRVPYNELCVAVRAAQPAPVPPGYKLVPVEPTPEMVDAARISGAEGTDEQIASDLRAAIAASPEKNP